MVSCIRYLCWTVLGLCIFQIQFTKGQGKGTYISLASEKIPRSVEKAKQTKLGQDQLFKFWTNDNNKFHELTKDKTFVLGSQVNFIKFVSLTNPAYLIKGACQLQQWRHWLLRHPADCIQQPLGAQDLP